MHNSVGRFKGRVSRNGFAWLPMLLAALSPVVSMQVHSAQVYDAPPLVQISATGANTGTRLVQNEKIYVHVDQAKIIRLPLETRTIIVGNPFVADISALRDGMGVLTAKSFGSTNLIIMGEKDDVLLEAFINVISPEEGIVIVQRGTERETYSCSPTCQPSIKLGDSAQYFGQASQQARARNDLATPRR